jgi:hypothetical protein
MQAPILVFDGGLHLYPSRSAAERALAGGPRPLDAFDGKGRPLRLVEGSRGWLGLFRRGGVHLEAREATAEERRQLRLRLAAALAAKGVPLPWAEGAPLAALMAEAARRLRSASG